MQDYQDRLAIATPEGVRMDLVLGGLGSRFAAALVDLLIKAVVLGAISLVAVVVGAFGVALASIAGLVVYVGYDIAFEVLAGGRTPGKRLCGLRVLRADGRAVDPLSSTIRNVMRLIDGLVFLYLPGMVSILVTRHNQRLGDLAGGTIVVRDAAPGPADPQPADDEEGPERFAPGGWLAPDAAALDVTGVTAADLAALRAFLERRPGLPARTRADLAARLAGAIRPRVGGGASSLADEGLIERVVAARDR